MNVIPHRIHVKAWRILRNDHEEGVNLLIDHAKVVNSWKYDLFFEMKR